MQIQPCFHYGVLISKAVVSICSPSCYPATDMKLGALFNTLTLWGVEAVRCWVNSIPGLLLSTFTAIPANEAEVALSESRAKKIQKQHLLHTVPML